MSKPSKLALKVTAEIARIDARIVEVSARRDEAEAEWVQLLSARAVLADLLDDGKDEDAVRA